MYVTQVMMDVGYGADDPALLLTHWKYYLRCVINAIIDARIHCDGMTEDEAVALMVDGGFQEDVRGPCEVFAGTAVIDPALDLLRGLVRAVGHGAGGPPPCGRRPDDPGTGPARRVRAHARLPLPRPPGVGHRARDPTDGPAPADPAGLTVRQGVDLASGSPCRPAESVGGRGQRLEQAIHAIAGHVRRPPRGGRPGPRSGLRRAVAERWRHRRRRGGPPTAASSRSRSRSRYSTPCQVLSPIAVRTGVAAEPRLDEPGVRGPSRPAQPRRAGERQEDADEVGDGPAVGFVESGLVQAGGEGARQPQFVVPGPARRGHVGARAPARPSATGRARRRGPPDRVGPGRRSADGSASVRASRTRAASATAVGSPATAGRLGHRREERREPSLEVRRPGPRVASPSRTARTAPSVKIARSGAWTGSSWSSRNDSSSDGTPAPPSRAASLRPLAGDAVPDLAELPEHVAAVGLEVEPQAAFPELAARAQVLQAGPGVAERHERRRVVRAVRGPPRASGGRAAASRRPP